MAWFWSSMPSRVPNRSLRNSTRPSPAQCSTNVTRREGVSPGLYWTTGTVVAEHKIDVHARIPSKFFEMARAAAHRIVYLQFRIKDEKVLFAWCALEDRGTMHVDILNDGDFQNATSYNGAITDPGREPFAMPGVRPKGLSHCARQRPGSIAKPGHTRCFCCSSIDTEVRHEH